MKTDNISSPIKTALNANINRTAPAGLHLRIMHEVRKQQHNIAPPNRNGLLLLALAVAFGAILFPFLVSQATVTAATSNFSLPQLALPPAFLYSILVVAILVAADTFFGTLRLKHQLK